MAGLYFHIPFRTARRSYDDSYYEVVPDENRLNADLTRFVDALATELKLYAQDYAEDEPVRTIYAGGGRPSLLRLHHIRSLLNTVLDVFDASAFEESTAEINPEDATRPYLSGLRNVGFNRLSIGVLSFYPDDLLHLGAPHTASGAVRSIRTAFNVGFETLAIDLAFGWPEQSIERWEDNLQQAIDMGIPSVTLIEWRPEAESAPMDQTDGDENGDRIRRAHMLKRANELLDDAGYAPYELTHFAQPGHESTHLRNIYSHGSYIGVGPSAESFWWPNRDEQRGARRWTNIRDVDRYVSLLGNRYPPIAYRQTADWTSLAREYIFLRLRTSDGLNLSDLRDRYGYDLLSTRGALVEKLVENQLIDDPDTGFIRLTHSGRLVTDGITERLMPS